MATIEQAAQVDGDKFMETASGAHLAPPVGEGLKPCGCALFRQVAALLCSENPTFGVPTATMASA